LWSDVGWSDAVKGVERELLLLVCCNCQIMVDSDVATRIGELIHAELHIREVGGTWPRPRRDGVILAFPCSLSCNRNGVASP